MTEKTTLPILYSFRRCPYAMRARMAIQYSGIAVELREVMLSKKPASMLAYSPKGTVPVLILQDNTVIEESREIIDWALSINDPQQWLPCRNKKLASVTEQLIDENDSTFKQALDKYKYHIRYPEHTVEDYRAQGCIFLAKLEALLAKERSEGHYLLGNAMSVADIAIFPFVRQFAHVDKAWFQQTAFPCLQNWLEGLLASELFHSIMRKQALWEDV